MVSAAYLVLLLHVLIIPGTLGQSIGDLRLYSSYSFGGRLEMYYSFSYGWIPFTITGFDMQDADLACKKLRYSYASRYAKVGSLGYSQASTIYSTSNVTCSSSASTFSSCSYYSTYSYSNHSSDVGLQCTNSISSLRLVSSSGSYYGVSSGRLEIYVNGTWGTVCDDNFYSTEASVACRQLGFSSYSRYSSADSTIGYASTYGGQIWLDSLKCNYASSDLRQCTNAVGVHKCNHGEDIILSCSRGYTTSPYYYTSTSTPRSGALRLISYGSTGSYKSSGRLEIYYYQSSTGYRWTPFCYTNFDSHEADLACKKLGFYSASSYGRVGNLGFDQGSGSYSISSYCSSYATSFSSCSQSTTSSCSHYNDVGLRCINYYGSTTDYTSSYFSSGSLRLISYGSTSSGRYEGRLEVYYSYSSSFNWTTFCISGFSSHVADVACKQLGFTRASNYGRAEILGYAEGSGSRSITSVYCPSYASSLRSCTYFSSSSSSYSCSHYNDVAISCTYAGYADSSVSPGLVVGLVVGSLILCSALCVGGAMCAVVIGVVYRKKKIRTNVVQRQPQSASEIGTYRMSDLEARENELAPNVFRPVATVRYTPSPFTPVTLQHDNVYPQNGNLTEPEVENSVAEIKIKDNINDSYTSDDEKPVIE